MRAVLVFLGFVALVTARPEGRGNRIIGGTDATIEEYPYSVSVLYYNAETSFQYACGGVILNQRSILTTAGNFNPCCGEPQPESRCNSLARFWRSRVGSSFANEGGTVHLTSRIIINNAYDPMTGDSDIAIIRAASFITYVPDAVGPARIAGENYAVADNQPVTAIGWGIVTPTGPLAEQLQSVQIYTVNREQCSRLYYGAIGLGITENMLCAGWITDDDDDRKGQCIGDFGSPILHTDVVVGISSWGWGCGHPVYPGVSTRVSRFVDWIRANS